MGTDKCFLGSKLTYGIVRKTTTTYRKTPSTSAKMQGLEQDNVRLETENKQLKVELQSFQNEKEVAGNNILEHAQQGEKEEKEGKRAALDQDIHQQIDHYLSEIDNCIEWLRQQ